ncbi:MAG: diguanylate cyclase domain-containing protein, partial [Moraxellaceae bacterium]
HGVEVLAKPVADADWLARVHALLALAAGRQAIEASLAGADWQHTLREGLLAIAHDGQVRYANPQAGRWLRLSPLALTRLHLLSLLEPPVAPLQPDWAGTPLAHAIAQGTVLDIHPLTLWRQDGGSLTVRAALVPQPNGPFAALFAFGPAPPDTARQQAARLAHVDLLTGLPSRPALEAALRPLTGGTLRPAVLLLDIDHLRHINQTLGHGLGDQLLQAAAARLRGAREPGLLVALGGGRFAFLCDDVADYRAAGRLAQRLKAQFRLPFLLAGHEVFCTVSIGIALYPASGHDPDTLLTGAELALNRAKALGRNLIQFDSAELNRFSIERMEREAALQAALAEGRLALTFHEWHDADGRVRWRQPWPVLSGIDDVPQLAAECGLAGALGDWLLAALPSQWPPAAGTPAGLVLSAGLFGLPEPEAAARLLALCPRLGLSPADVLLVVRWREDEAARWPGVLARLAAQGMPAALYLDGRGATLQGLLQARWQALVLGQRFMTLLARPEVTRAQAEAVLAAALALGAGMGWPVHAETWPSGVRRPPALASAGPDREGPSATDQFVSF